MVSQPNTHVLTIDYRGFGHSTGSPTEAGLITDGVALVIWLLDVAKIHPERIVILGQSLGTAVASAVALHFVDPTSTLLPQVLKRMEADAEPLLSGDTTTAMSQQKRTSFAGVVLVAPFASLPSLMLTYRMSGIVPLLAPLRPFPFITKPVLSRMIDQWPTAERLAAYYNTLTANPKLLVGHGERRMGSLQILHATSDMDISWRQTEMIVKRVLGTPVDASEGSALLDIREPGRPDVRVEIGQYGGK
jgi:abhydrolase domain-containing protein 12